MTAAAAARRPGPHRRIRDAARHRPGGAARQHLRRQGRDARHRRRIRLRQIGHLLCGDAHPRPRRHDRRRLGDVLRHRRARRAAKSEMRDLRGREMSMIFQNPRAALNPIRKVGRPDRGRAAAARAGAAARCRSEKAIEALEQVRIARPARALSRLSVRTVRRHVPARRDRAGARLPAAAPDRRRADHRPRRHHAEGGDGPRSSN